MLANVCSTKWREQDRIQRKDLSKGHEVMMDAYWLALYWLVVFASQDCPGVVQPKEGCVLLYQSCVKKMFHRFPYRPVVQKRFLKWGFLFPDDHLNKQTNTFTSTHCNLWWPGTLYIDQNDFKLTEIWLSICLSLLNVGIKGDHCHAWMICVGVSCLNVLYKPVFLFCSILF